MTLLDRAAILAAPDIATELAEVPEWGGQVRLRGLSAAALSAVRISSDGKEADAFMLAVLGASLTDETGALLFPGEAGQAELGTKNPAVLNRLFEVAARVNAFGMG
ncbi:MAG: hypothetical protein ACREMG_15385, partial [Gemmatimonadales bacterium]